MNSPEWRQALLGSLGATLFGAIQPLYAFALGSMISVYFLEDHDEIKRRTMIYALCFVGLAVFTMIINIIQHYNFAAMGEHLTKRIRERMLAKILTFEIGWFDQDDNSSGAICSRLAKDANVVWIFRLDGLCKLLMVKYYMSLTFILRIFVIFAGSIFGG